MCDGPHKKLDESKFIQINLWYEFEENDFLFTIIFNAPLLYYIQIYIHTNYAPIKST